MAIQVTMPKLSDTMEEGVISKWLKKEGEPIEAGEVIAEAESDKATMELEAFDAGILRKILIPDGGKVAVGGIIAIIAEADEDISEFLQEKPKAAEPAKAPQPEPEAAKPAPATEKPEPSESIHAAPVIDKTPDDELLTTDTVSNSPACTAFQTSSNPM